MIKKISAVVPCYNEEESLPLFYDEICRVAQSDGRFTLEMIFVDDGSKDGTLRELRELAKNDARVRYISFSRNFGKESAMLAGLRASTGEYVAILDADLQHPPALLTQMFTMLEEDPENCDVVATRRDDRSGEPPLRSFFSRRFYRFINRISQTEIVEGAQDYRLMRRAVVDSILSMGEYNRFSKGIFSWVGFRTKWITHQNPPRVAGTTKWSFWKLLLYSLDGITAFSTKPLAIASITGLALCLIAFLLLVFVVVRTILWGDPVAGWPSMICIILLMSGIQLFSVGILGQYMAKTYLETKNRPAYIIRETSAVCDTEAVQTKDENEGAENLAQQAAKDLHSGEN